MAYQASLGATGGNGQLAFSLAGGALPPGISLASDGTLSGTPTAAGTLAFQVRATSADGQSSTAELVLFVRDVLMITTSTLPGGVVGRSYSAAINAVGGDSAYTWFVDAGTLPAGLSFSDRGIFSGTPDSEQAARFTGRVRSGDGQTAVRELSITIAGEGPAALSVRTALLPPAIVGLRYDPVLRASVGSGEPVTWSLALGSLPPGVQLAPNGSMSGAPTAPGSFALTVRAAAGSGRANATFTIRVDPHDLARFNVTRFDVVQVPASIAPHVAAAFARWERVIVGHLPVDSIPRGFFGNSSCGGFGDEANGTGIDDVLVMVNIDSIDGPGEVLGQAGPCAFREADNLTGVGLLTLDESDLEALANTQTLTDILFHEIGHVLGFGTLWDGSGCVPGAPRCLNYVEGEGGEDPTFTGPEAVREWQALGGTGAVPIENRGGSGTRLSHWRESVFDSEIMTGFIERTGAPNPLSRATIASLADLGYPVSHVAADPYALPAAAALAAPALTSPGWELPLPDPPVPLTPR